jgi:hypothetical protein
MEEFNMVGMVEHPGHPDQSVHGRRGGKSPAWDYRSGRSQVRRVQIATDKKSVGIERVGGGKARAKMYLVRGTSKLDRPGRLGISKASVGRLERTMKGMGERGSVVKSKFQPAYRAYQNKAWYSARGIKK